MACCDQMETLLSVRWLRRCLLVVLMLTCHTGKGVPGLFAQGIFGNNANTQKDEELFLLAPRALSRLLREGEQAIKDKRYSEGIAALASLLNSDLMTDPNADLNGQDYFIESTRTSYYTKSLKSEAIRLLSQLPEEGRRSLEIQFGVTARQELDRAVANRDFEAVAVVARKYPHTEAGYDGLVLLAQYKLAGGYPLAAASLLQSMLDYPAARQRYGVQLASATALAMRQAGRKDLAIAVMQRADRDFAGAEIKVNGRAIKLGSGADWSAQVDQLVDEVPRMDSLTVDSWMVTGGTPERNATSTIGMPLSNARWVERIHGSLKEAEALNTVAATARQQRRVILPKFELRIVNDLVLSKATDNGIFPRDIETGQLPWLFYFHSAPLDLNNGFASPSEGMDASDAVSSELKNRVWGSSAFGDFSCDSERFYFVSSADEQPIKAAAMFGMSRMIPSNTNYLEGVGIASQGAILWRVGGASGEQEPLLAGAYFLGPPLPFEDQLYSLVEINGETRLVVLETTTGKLLWQQQLSQTQEAAANQDALRRSMALSPTISDGVIVCPTGYGAVVAVDMQTRSLRWGKAYTTTRNPIDNNMRVIGGSFRTEAAFDPLEERWHGPAVIAHQGLVVLTIPDSNSLMCLDILTGLSRWKSESERRLSGRYVLGVNSEHVVVAGNSEVYAYRVDTKDGKIAWQLPFPKGQVLAGKGIWQGNSMLIPLSNQQVIKVDAATGKLLDTATVDMPLGNLFAYKEQLLSVNPTAVAAYFTRDSLAREVQARVAKNPDDTWALNQQSQLAIAAGKLPEAVQVLERSFQLDPKNAETRFLLIETLLKAFDVDFDKYQVVAQKYDDVFELSEQRYRYLQSLALGNVRNKMHYAAFERILELMRARLAENLSTQQRRRESLTIVAGHTVDSDAWIAAQLARCYAEASPADRKKMQAAILQQLGSVKNSMLTTRRQLLRYFAWLPDTASTVLTVAEELIASDSETTAVERLLQPAWLSNDKLIQGKAAELLYNNPISDWGTMGPFGTYAQSMLDVGVGVPLNGFTPSGNALNDDADLKQTSLPLGELQSLKPEWPRGFVEYRRGEQGAPVGDIETIRSNAGPPLSGSQFRYGRPHFSVSLLGSNLLIVNELGQRIKMLSFDRATGDIQDSIARCQVNGGLILVETASELLAIDLYRQLDVNDALIWRHSLMTPSPSPFREASQMSTVARQTPYGFAIQERGGAVGRQVAVGPLTPVGVVVKSGTVLSMLDSLTGAVVWTREGFGDQVRFASSGLELSVVEPSTGVVQVLDARDGLEIRRFDFRGDWQAWHARGSLLVDYKIGKATAAAVGIATDADNPTTVRVWNAFSNEIVQQIELAPRSLATLCEDRYMVIMEPTGAKTGKLHYLDLETQSYATHNVDRDAGLDMIQAMRFEERLIVVGFDSKEWRDGGLQAKNLKLSRAADSMLACGYIYGLNTLDGSTLWPRPARLHNYLIPKRQPHASPFLVAHRSAEGEIVRANATAGLVLVDLRDGSLAFANDSIPVASAGNVAMAINPVENKITVRIGTTDIVFTPTDGERPPQPVFQFGNSRKIIPSQSFPLFGN